MQFLFSLCAVVYLLIYAFEGVIRYGLYNVGMDNAILLRDGLMIGPPVLLFVVQAFRLRVHPAFAIFAAILALHGAVAAFNLHTIFPAIYGAMLLINVLFGFIAARQLTHPGRAVVRLLALVWLVSIVGILLDKFVYTFPWMGLETHIGGIAVDVSRGWDITGGLDKRAAGFMRSSIAAAMLLPTLALLIAPRIRNWLIRAAVITLTVGAVFLTTQKGSLVAISAVGLILLFPSRSNYFWLCIGCVAFAILTVALPVVTDGLLITDNGGVFSLSSFGMRIMDTWPDAWQWIRNNEVFPFGVGLGGIGGAQRFYAQNFFNPSDNLFVFMYANFGVMSLFYLAWAVWQGLRVPQRMWPAGVTALALLAFNLGYGAALSMLEDPVSGMFFGASIGMLWQLRQMALGGRWRDPYLGADLEFRQRPIPPVHVPAGGDLVRVR
jgi:hypothetical protein